MASLAFSELRAWEGLRFQSSRGFFKGSLNPKP